MAAVYTLPMIRVPAKEELLLLREFLDAHSYDTASLTAQLGQSKPPAPGQVQNMFDESREITTPNVLIRLFLLGSTIDEATVREFLPGGLVSVLADHGMLSIENGLAEPRIVIIPVEDLLFVSDAYHVLGGPEASEFVLPASTHSANFLRLTTIRDPVDRALDLGCGCGILTLFAARHARTVVASDISEAAIRYTKINAALNGFENVEYRLGSVFEPVAGETFDLIVSNPPFVIGPSDRFEYRDNRLQLDEFCRVLVREAPRYLNEDGHLQMLCEWVEIANEPWRQRVESWVSGLGCDGWALHSAPRSPYGYVQQRTSDISGEGVDAGAAVEEWTRYFEEHNVHAIHPGMLVLRKRNGNNWLHFQNLPADVEIEAGGAVARQIAACDFLEACGDDESLQSASLCLADALAAYQQGEDDPNGPTIVLKLTDGLSMDAEIDGTVAAFINFFNGERTVGECIAEFSKATSASAEQLAPDLLSIVRTFVLRGFLEPI
ncbi:MAG: methyltransferase [Woeseiaceae bacterium]|nr:methyltransferase [Woeseiaceae bacterium]